MCICTGVSDTVLLCFPESGSVLSNMWPLPHMFFHLWTAFFSKNLSSSDLICQLLSQATLQIHSPATKVAHAGKLNNFL